MEIIGISLHSGKQIDFYVCPTFLALLNGDLEGLKNLLYFGYTVKEYKMALHNANTLFSFVPQFNFRCNDYLNLYDHGSECGINSKNIELEVDEDYPLHFFRHGVVHEVIVFLLKYLRSADRKRRSSMVKCFHLLWRSRPTPYVRNIEILRVLKEDWIFDGCPEKCWRRLYMACYKYNALFGDIAQGALAPRSLKHLSRCAVRESLMKNTWSSGIKKLDIPKDLKSYLLLET